ncbi:MAG: metal-dependent phosphohydrolase [Treponema sp.]|jgi:hypothetical protein|nr:metal-dependent phosphohydrolase [Treponema sp.]
MAEKDTIISVSKVLAVPGGTGISKAHVDIMLREDIPVHCINRGTQKKRLMPFNVLYNNNNVFWRQGGGWEYFITGEDFEKIKEKAVSKHSNWETETADRKSGESNKPDPHQGYGNEYKTISTMTIAEKIQQLNSHKQRLNSLIMYKSKDETTVTEALVDTARDAALINRAALEEAMRLGDGEAKKITQELVNSTTEMVKSSTALFAENIFNDKLMNILVEKSNGTIVQHMTRVYLNGISFLLFYNNLVSTSSAINKLRISFAAKYRDFYHRLLPHIPIDNIVLERVFYKGMRAIPPELFFNWAVGFLIHDIGKASAVEYHEGGSAYNRNIVIEHVKMGYQAVMNKTNYPMEASLITGYHHEYYGDPAGYGYFRAYLEQHRRENPGAKQDYCITYELEPIMEFQALAYFPAKVLEIIDVYDSVIDPSRAHHKASTPEEALTMIRAEFIEKYHKLDPILFDLFAEFIREKQKNI